MKKSIKYFVVLGAAVSFCVYALWQGLQISTYQIVSEKVNAPIRLALITDLHSTWYGQEQKQLIQAIDTIAPHAILMAGDIIDDELPFDACQVFFENVGKRYPCYYALGNHEFWIPDPNSSVKEWARQFGITVLDGVGAPLDIQGQTVEIYGIDDPAGGRPEWRTQFDQVCMLAEQSTNYKILLSHRPEMIQYYQDSGFDLVVSGHAHGGQVRIPFLLDGLFAPGQGFFPKYTSGIYSLGQTQLAVSRGLAQNHLPRVFNRPEIVVIDIIPPQV